MADKATLIDRYPGTLGIILGCLISMGVFGVGEAVQWAGMNPFLVGEMK